MIRLSNIPLWMAIWIHIIRGRRDCKNGVADVRGLDKESGILVVSSEYLKLLEERRKKLTGETLDEYQVEISDLVVRLKEVKKGELESVENSNLDTRSSEENRKKEEIVRLKKSIVKRHKEYIKERNEIDSSYRVLEKAYYYGIKVARKGGEKE